MQTVIWATYYQKNTRKDKKFCTIIYKPFFEDFERYKNCDPNVNLPEFWYWYEEKYLNEELLK